MTQLNRMDEVNVQCVHLARLFSAFHWACNPVNVIASFRNAGIAVHLDDGMLMSHVDVEECRCLLCQVDLFSTSAQEDAAEPAGETNESDESNVPDGFKSSTKKPHYCLTNTQNDFSEHLFPSSYSIHIRICQFTGVNITETLGGAQKLKDKPPQGVSSDFGPLSVPCTPASMLSLVSSFPCALTFPH
jgi:hypothetical protein